MAAKLKWEQLDFRDFQRLSLQVAQVLFPDQLFEEYLKQGNKQHGIDIRNIRPAERPDIYFQCKNEKGFNTTGKVESALQEFLTGKFAQPGSRFFIITSAELQTTNRQNWIDQRRQEVMASHQVDFSCLDVNFLEQNLETQWRIVDQFFGRAEAEHVCQKDLRLDIVEKLKPVTDPIPRRVVQRPESNTLAELFWCATNALRVHLTEVFTKDRLTAHQICLLGDPYQGKSTYLQQVAYELANSGQRIKPVLLDMKSYNVGMVESLLDQACGEGWKQIATKDFVLIFDGLDETPAGHLVEMMKNIRTFAESYYYVNIIVSCRSLFYEDYGMREIIGCFRVYEICPLEGEDIQQYLRRQLGGRPEKFMKAAMQNGLVSWLYHPFYLVTLIAEYKEKRKLPESSLNTVKTFIQRAFEKAKSRLLNDGETVRQKYDQFETAVKKLAMALQLAGKNAFTQAEIDKLFPSSEEKELLRINPMITENRGHWSFTNAFLQEHLAATHLAAMEYDKILDLVSVGQRIRKIRTKWIQTVSSVLAMIAAKSDLFKKLIELVKTDSPELIFQTERSIYPAPFKLDALKKFVHYLVANNIWPLISRPESVGIFVADVPGAATYLIECISNPTFSDDKKELCCRILQQVPPTEPDKTTLLSLFLDQIETTHRISYAGELVGVLAAHKMGNTGTIASVIAIPDQNRHHPFRDKMYEWILQLNLVKEYWLYGIEGLPILLRYNRPTTHGGSEYGIQSFLSEFTNLKQARSLFRALGTREMLTFPKLMGIGKEGFYKKVFRKCTELFENGGKSKDGRILVVVSDFIKTVGSYYFRRDFPEIDEFLENTGTHAPVTRLLMKDLLSGQYWEPGPIIPEEAVDILLAEFDDGHYDPSVLRIPAMALYPPNKLTATAEFEERCIGATGGAVFPKIDQKQQQKINQAEQKRQANNLKTARSRRSFQNGVKKYFQLQRKEMLTLQDLYQFAHQDSLINIAGTDLIIAFIRMIIERNIPGTLKNCLANLQDDTDFEYFRTTELLRKHPHDPEATQGAEDILRDYYFRHLPLCHFVNTYYKVEDYVYSKPIEDLVGRLFIQFEFPTEEKYLVELTWLDRFGIYQPQNYLHSQESGLYQKIKQQLEHSSAGMQKLQTAVLDHLRAGIQVENVLLSHFTICGHLGITDAIPHILDALLNRNVDNYEVEQVCRLYIDLGGDRTALLPLFETCKPSDSFYFYLLQEIGKELPEKVMSRCLSDIADPGLSDRDKILSAQWLTNLGYIQGFQCLAAMLTPHPDYISFLHGGLAVGTINTKDGLHLLWDVRSILADPRFDAARPPHSAKMILGEWLFAFSEKGESDLLQVQEYLQKAEADLLLTMPEASALTWYQHRILENARKREEKTMPISDVKRILKSIDID
jgi:hypothetical protein